MTRYRYYFEGPVDGCVDPLEGDGEVAQPVVVGPVSRWEGVKILLFERAWSWLPHVLPVEASITPTSAI